MSANIHPIYGRKQLIERISHHLRCSARLPHAYIHSYLRMYMQERCIMRCYFNFFSCCCLLLLLLFDVGVIALIHVSALSETRSPFLTGFLMLK